MTQDQKPPEGSKQQKTKLDEETKKAKSYEEKKKGPIRFEALIPLGLVIGLLVFYFFTLFDLHLKKLVEWGAYEAWGAEVNVARIETSFLKASFRLQNLEVTNPDKPSHNALVIGDIRFSMLWDALLRARVVIEEFAVEQISIDSPRKMKGKVKPPAPPSEKKSSDSSALLKEGEKIRDQALGKVEAAQPGNALVEAVSLFGKGGSVGSLPAQWEQQLASRAHLAELEKFVQALQKKWPQEFAKLPQAGVFESFKQRGALIKTSGFSNPQELQNSIQQAQSLLKDIDSEVQKVQAAQKALSSDISSLDEGTKKLQSLVDADLNSLQSKMGIPSIDAKSLVKGLVMDVVNPHLQRLRQAQAQMQKYLPPNLKNKEGQPENSIKPHPRALGVSYEFGRPQAYPLFWVKKISISSKSTPTGFSGDVTGSLTDITSNQLLTAKPSKLALQAEFPRQGVQGLRVDAGLDQRGAESRMDFAAEIQSYLLNPRILVQSPDVNIGYETGRGALKFRANLRDLKKFSYSAENQFNSLALQISSANAQAQEVLRNIFSAIPLVTLDIWGEAELPDFPVNINSNLGPAFARAFEKELQRILAEARRKIESEVQRIIGEERKKLDLQIQTFRGQAESEVKKAQGQADEAKGRVEAQVAQARKDFEDQAQRERKKLEEQVKRSLGQDADKKLEDLKKKLNISL